MGCGKSKAGQPQPQPQREAGVVGEEAAPSGATLLTAEKQPPVSKDSQTYSINVSKTDNTELGLDLREKQGAMYVERIFEGLVQNWNDHNPDLKVQSGDRLMEINNMTEVEGMLAELEKTTDLRLTLVRARPTERQPSENAQAADSSGGSPSAVAMAAELVEPPIQESPVPEPTTTEEFEATGRAPFAALELEVEHAISEQQPIEEHSADPEPMTTEEFEATGRAPFAALEQEVEHAISEQQPIEEHSAEPVVGPSQPEEVAPGRSFARCGLLGECCAASKCCQSS